MPAPAATVFVTQALSAAGDRLAYLTCRQGRCTLDVSDLDDHSKPKLPSRRLVNQVARFNGLTWAPDGESVIYGDQPAPELYWLWRAWLDGSRKPERVELAGLGARMPAISGHRLVFTRSLNSVGISTLDSRPVLSSSFWDIQPQFSPDGKQIAFSSTRAGDGIDIWLASADGSNPRQLTHGPGLSQGSPAWSPDGRTIAFDSRDTDGVLTVWTIDADGGTPRRITKGAGSQHIPTWSRDGRWIYFSSDSGSGNQTWRVAVAGGAAQQITPDRSEAFAEESMDGTALIYKRTLDDGPLFSQPFAGGVARTVVPCVGGVDYAVAAAGIYFASCSHTAERVVHLLDTAGHDRILGPLTHVFGLDRMSVSPDGKTILVIKQQTLTNDLWAIDNFR
jgi:eukaryotic-like serine/threonine-protein kinase